MNVKKLIVEIEVRRKAIGLERDKLREMRISVEELEDVCERAYDDLEAAIEALSELV